MMPSTEQEEIAATVAAFLADRLPVTRIGHEFSPDGPEIDPGVWRQCAELGWLALGLAEDAGGVGYGLVEETMVFRELGRGVAPGPFLPGVLGAHLAAAAGRADLAGSIAAGETLVALGTPVGTATIADTVSAELSIVHAAGADLVLVADDEAAALVPLGACAPTAIDAVDGSVRAARGSIDGGAAVAAVDAAVAPIFRRGLVLAAASATGVAEGALRAAVQHAGQRVQFGKPIGVNQAIKHRCADMAVRCEGAWAQVGFAAVCVDGGLDGDAREAAIAKFYADQAARLNSEGAVQIHGAMGFTSEATPHRFVYRGHLLARCLASRAGLLDRIVRRT